MELTKDTALCVITPPTGWIVREDDTSMDKSVKAWAAATRAKMDIAVIINGQENIGDPSTVIICGMGEADFPVRQFRSKDIEVIVIEDAIAPIDLKTRNVWFALDVVFITLSQFEAMTTKRTVREDSQEYDVRTPD